MTTENTQSAPETPAASLLFQAPAFQAPVFRAPEPAAPDDEGGDEEPRAKKPRARRATTAQASQATPEEAPGEEPAQTAEDDKPRRRRRSAQVAEEPAQTPKKKGRRSAKDKDAAEAQEPADQAPSVDEPADESPADDSEETEGSTRRRRRRRTRSTSSSTEESADPVDQIKALKGSTRLEAKKQRRREGRKEGRRHHGITESEFLARRESVSRTMVIRDHEGLDQIAILEDGLLVEHYVARRTQKSMVGNIYLGRVQNVLPSMEAAFVDIGRGRNAVLYAGEVNWDAVGLDGKPRRIESALKSGDPVLVQVTKDPIGHKGARLTSQITLAGRYLVLIPNGSMMGISRKLPDKERARLKKILKQVVPDGSGVIVRTAAEGASEQQIRDDVARLTKQWADIEAKRKSTKSAPVLLRGEPELAVRVVRDIFNEDFTSLIVQGGQTFRTVHEYVEELSPELSDRVEQWVGTEDVFHAHRIDEQLAKGMDRKVWLPSGGTLVIDRTEAMTVIDVNTGKYIGAGGTLEETVTRNNLEAAEEIVRQLRLRDIGGIIIVDFVDMVLEQNRDLVLRRLVECLGRDRTRHQVTEITSLGLVQMTRKRVGEGLVEAFSTTCEACEGRGFIVHDHPVELTGSHDRTGASPKSGKRKKAQAEPRRIEDTPEHEKAREALSAIAAATRKDDKEDAAASAAGSDEQAPASNAQSVEAVEAPAPKRPRRRRAATAAVVEPSSDPSEAVAVEAAKARAKGSAGPEGDAVERVESAPTDTPARPRRRRAATASVVEPEQASSTPVIDLPIRVEQAQEAPRAASVDIALPDAPSSADAPARTKRRRRAVSTGVVDAG
ncbi:Rne/Rng family ribonuclease [Actinomyces sp. B33]|uniref:Rne/Rng family ribonuclease n=1 Tax=Actinomyces sp. B33 TaxID=2942131 RepID=UPI002341DEA5|nr:Rne/Rng family ribonuclease [Actinomyces sp. B33]MDC4233124.1 Rne/Rng family ribonuclease [Actinomyces sp. B33]